MARRYSVIYSEDLTEFVAQCTDHLNTGWECAGGLQIKEREYLQAFIRGEDTETVVKKAPPRRKKADRPRKKE